MYSSTHLSTTSTTRQLAHKSTISLFQDWTTRPAHQTVGCGHLERTTGQRVRRHAVVGQALCSQGAFSCGFLLKWRLCRKWERAESVRKFWRWGQLERLSKRLDSARDEKCWLKIGRRRSFQMTRFESSRTGRMRWISSKKCQNDSSRLEFV